MKGTVVYCLGGMCAALLLPVALAMGAPAGSAFPDGTPNLGTARICQQDARWFVDARVFSTSSGQSWWDNTPVSVGFTSPIDEDTEFSLTGSYMSNSGKDPIAGSIVTSRRVILGPYIKRAFSKCAHGVVSLTIGADVALSRAKAYSMPGLEAYQNDFTPAAKLQAEWGKPGKTQWQLAAQVAFWDTMCSTSAGGTIPGFGTVVGLGGGVSVPIGGKLTLVADAMGIVGGKNTLNISTDTLANEWVWSAGGNWLFGGAYDTCLSVYATNAMGPTPGSSLIAAPDNSVALGLALRRVF
jgi:hypothetical protein